MGFTMMNRMMQFSNTFHVYLSEGTSYEPNPAPTHSQTTGVRAQAIKPHVKTLSTSSLTTNFLLIPIPSGAPDEPFPAINPSRDAVDSGFSDKNENKLARDWLWQA